MSGTRLTAAYVLHQQPYRNTSLLVEAVTADAGRVGLVARGVRSRSNRSAALLQPFHPLLLAWQGRGELRTLSRVEEAGPAQVPKGRALFAAYYCNELLLRLCQRESPEPAAFAAYVQSLGELAAGGRTEPALRRFELDLLDALGYAPPIAVAADSGEPVTADAEYDFLGDHGPVAAVPGARPVPSSVRVSGRELLALASRELDDPAVLRSARAIVRLALEPLLGNRPLKTRQVYRSLFGS